jgi:hypothetical protein
LLRLASVPAAPSHLEPALRSSMHSPNYAAVTESYEKARAVAKQTK